MKKTIRTLAAVFISVPLLLAFASTAFADNALNIGIAYFIQDGEIVDIQAAVPVIIPGSGMVVLYTNNNHAGEDVQIVLQTVSGEYPCEENGSVIYVSGEYDDPAFADLAEPSEGQSLALHYLTAADDAQFGISVAAVTVTDLRITGALVMTLNNMPDDFQIAPAALIDGNGNCVGIVSDRQTAVAEWITADDGVGEAPGGAGGAAATEQRRSSNMTLFFVIAAVAASVLLFRSQKNKGSAPRSKSEPDMYSDVSENFDSDFDHDVYTSDMTVPDMDMGDTSYKLRGLGGYMDGRTYSVSGKELTIGRSHDMAIRYPDATKGISRRHCKIFIFDGKLMLMDLGSTYGTFVSGKGRIIPDAPVPLKRGDTFFVGDKRNKFIIE